MAEGFMTAEGKKELEERLEYLKGKGRAEIAEMIRIAREYGDLSENAEYDIAKDEQAKMEAEIVEIEAKLANVTIIDEKSKGDEVKIGCRVKILDLQTGEELLYQIVGTTEANPMQNRISNESPVGRALLGKKKNEEALVKTPKGELRFKVVKIN